MIDITISFVYNTHRAFVLTTVLGLLLDGLLYFCRYSQEVVSSGE